MKTSIDMTHAWAGLSPLTTASTPNEIPYTPTATPIPAARVRISLERLGTAASIAPR